MFLQLYSDSQGHAWLRIGYMALIALGHSQCAICGGVLQETDDILGFPDGPLTSWDHSTQEIWSLIHRFADRGCHRSCFVALPQADIIYEIYFGRKL